MTRARILADYVSSGDELALKAPLASPAFTGSPSITLGSDATGDIYYRAADGALTRLATGADGTVLTSTGAAAVPAFEASAVGGKVLQVQFDNSDTTYSNSGTPWDTKMTDLVCLITPASASNKIIITMSTYMVVAAGQYIFIDWYKNASDVAETYNLSGLSGGGFGPTGSGAGFDTGVAHTMVDTAGTTNEITYSVSFRSGDSATVSCGNNNHLSTIIAIEIEV